MVPDPGPGDVAIDRPRLPAHADVRGRGCDDEHAAEPGARRSAAQALPRHRPRTVSASDAACGSTPRRSSPWRSARRTDRPTTESCLVRCGRPCTATASRWCGWSRRLLYSGSAGDAVDYSEGLDAAVSCHDYPQLYDMTAHSRRASARSTPTRCRRRSSTNPRIYAPFTVGEYLDSDWEMADWCLNWPVAPAAHPAGPPAPPSGSYPDVPTLVLTGELDSITTPEEGALVASAFPAARQVLVANSFHVTADRRHRQLRRTHRPTLRPAPAHRSHGSPAQLCEPGAAAARGGQLPPLVPQGIAGSRPARKRRRRPSAARLGQRRTDGRGPDRPVVEQLQRRGPRPARWQVVVHR